MLKLKGKKIEHIFIATDRFRNEKFFILGPKILASGSRDRLIHVFDVEQDYGLLQTLDDHSAAIQSVRFTDANNKLRMLSCGSDKSLLFRNAALNPDFEFSLGQHLVSKSTMYDMIIDPTQKFVATACQDRNIRVYNMSTAKQKKNYRASVGDEGTLLRIQLDPSGTYAATSCTDKNLCILEFYTGELTATVYGHSEIVTGLRFTNDLKHLISVSADSCIFVWRLPSDMTKTMRLRMEELGKMPQDENLMSDLSREVSLNPNPVSLDSTFTSSMLPNSTHFPVMKENISPARILSSMDPHPPAASSLPLQNASYPSTPVSRRSEPHPPKPSPADSHFSAGPLPNWAKAKFGQGGDGTDGGTEAKPKGRWAQRFDQNLAFKSQLDLTQLDDETDQRRVTGFEPSGLHLGGEIPTCASMPDLRRETVVLSQNQPGKNIPIIDDDDETNIDDDEDFFPAFLKGKLPGASTESDRSSSDHDDRKRLRQSGDLTGQKSEGQIGRRWGSRISLGNEDKTNSFDLDDTDDLDTWSDTTEVIYPPSEPESVDTYASTYHVYAVDESRKANTKRASNINDDDSESTDRVSLEDQVEDDPNDDTLVMSNASTPCEPDREFLPGTPDKEQFLKENFESVSFTPVPMDKFAQQVAILEQAAEASEPGSMPFSPRLSLSSRFLSRSQFVGTRAGTGLGGGQRNDNWLDMNWRTGGLLQESPEKEDPPSPPTKLDNKEPSFSTPKSGSSPGGPGSKLERDTSPIPASPTRNAPTNPTITSPSRGTSPLASREKRRSTSSGRQGETNGSSSSSSSSSASNAPPQRQVPSYFRTTKSSRLKTSASSSLLLKPSTAESQQTQNNIKNTSTGLQGSKIDGGKKRPGGKGRLSSSRLAMYASTPNLAHFHDNDDDVATNTTTSTTPEPVATEPTSNLRSLADLSLSVPDINCLDDAAASTDSSSSSGPVRKDRDKKAAGSGPLGAAKTLSSSRRSTGNIRGKELPPLNLANKKGESNLDSQLMPPPHAAPTARSNAQSGLLRRAVQVRKFSSSSEMTLEQAKSILLGNSGILGSQQNGTEEDTSPTTPAPPTQITAPTQQQAADSTGSASSQRNLSSTSTLLPTSPRKSSSSSRSSSSSPAVFDPAEPGPGYPPASTLAMAEEIDRTANQLKRERQRAAAAALNASRYDPPERDQPRKQPQAHPSKQQNIPASALQVTFDGPSNGGGPDQVEDDAQNLSVRERIALLNQHTPVRPGSADSSKRGSLDSERSQSPSLLPHSHTAGRRTMSPSPLEQHHHQQQQQQHQQQHVVVSPRSQSDTGLGSDTDTDSELRQYHHHHQQGGESGGVGAGGGARGDRTRLSLQLHNSSTSPTPPAALKASSASAANQEPMHTCTCVVADLKSAVERAKQFHSQLTSTTANNSRTSSATSSSSNHQQMMTILSEAFHEAHLTLAQLVLQSPDTTTSTQHHPHKPPSCPLVADSGVGAWDSTVMDKARDMLQPLLSQLSRELSDEVVKVITDRLKKGGQAP